MNEVYNGGFAPGFSVSMLKETLALVRDYVSETRKQEAKLAEKYMKLWNKRALSTGEPCTCEYVTLLQSFRRGTLSVYWYIAQNF